MNAPNKKISPSVEDALNELQPQLAKLRDPFPTHQISKLPKPTKKQTDDVKADFKKGIRCQVCGSWHHPDVVHLDYVGHAALTDRLLDTDLEWSWEPVGFTPEGLPALDRNGGLWIKLTVCGVTRYGYGAADGKSGGDAMKEMIGDALRNAAMRFGAALDLWHKGDLHADDEDTPANPSAGATRPGNGVDGGLPVDLGRGDNEMSSSALRASLRLLVHHINGSGSVADLDDVLDTEDAKEVIDNCQRRFPSWWETGEGMPAEFVPLKKLIEQTREGLQALENAE